MLACLSDFSINPSFLQDVSFSPEQRLLLSPCPVNVYEVIPHAFFSTDADSNACIQMLNPLRTRSLPSYPLSRRQLLPRRCVKLCSLAPPYYRRLPSWALVFVPSVNPASNCCHLVSCCFTCRFAIFRYSTTFSFRSTARSLAYTKPASSFKSFKT